MRCNNVGLPTRRRASVQFGVGVGKSSPTFDLGMIGNIISGLIGGGVLGQIVTLLLPAITAAAAVGQSERRRDHAWIGKGKQHRLWL
jgi:hypothetical protein